MPNMDRSVCVWQSGRNESSLELFFHDFYIISRKGTTIFFINKESLRDFSRSFPKIPEINGKLNDAVFESKANHLHRGGDAKFVEDIRFVAIDCPQGDVELIGNLFAK